MPTYAAWLFNHICILPNDRDLFDLVQSDLEEIGEDSSTIARVCDALLDMASTLYAHLRLNWPLHFLFTGSVVEVESNPYTKAWEVFFEPDLGKLEHAIEHPDTWGWLSNLKPNPQYALF